MAGAVEEPSEADDLFLDEVLDEYIAPYEILGNPFFASTVSRTDPDARQAIRLSLLDKTRDDIQNALDDRSLHRLDKLAERLPLGQVVPFIGAGLSVPLGFPGWGKFLVGCAKGMLPEATIEQYLAAGDYVGLTDAILSLPGGDRYMDERLSVFDRRVIDLGGLHRLLPILFGRLLYTTNYDRAIEEAYRGHDMRAVFGSNAWGGPKASYGRGDNVILKIHGDCMWPTTRILTGKEYEEAYSPTSRLRGYLAELFSDFAVVFMGCSLVSDRTLDVALEVAEARDRETAVNHFAFLPRPSAPEEEQAKEQFLSQRRIFPIWYPNDSGDHVLLGRMLWMLAASR